MVNLDGWLSKAAHPRTLGQDTRLACSGQFLPLVQSPTRRWPAGADARGGPVEFLNQVLIPGSRHRCSLGAPSAIVIYLQRGIARAGLRGSELHRNCATLPGADAGTAVVGLRVISDRSAGTLPAVPRAPLPSVGGEGPNDSRRGGDATVGGLSMLQGGFEFRQLRFNSAACRGRRGQQG